MLPLLIPLLIPATLMFAGRHTAVKCCYLSAFLTTCSHRSSLHGVHSSLAVNQWCKRVHLSVGDVNNGHRAKLDYQGIGDPAGMMYVSILHWQHDAIVRSGRWHALLTSMKPTRNVLVKEGPTGFRISS